MAGFGLIDKSNRSSIPLSRISISSKLHGFTAQVESTLEYFNNTSNPIEAIYVFPLDEDSAVCNFQATTSGKTIVAQIREKPEARDLFYDALSCGSTAYLLEESDESSDIFQINVGNLPPGVRTTVKITFVTTLKVEIEGMIIFSLPTVLNPRYSPKNGQDSVSKNLESLASLSKMYSFEFEMNVQCASPIQQVTSPYHRLFVDINSDDTRQATVRLDSNYRYDHDLEMHVLCQCPYQPRALVENGVTKSPSGCPDPFLSKPVVMVNFFPHFDTNAILERGEFVFIVDQSGSMGGPKMRNARESLILFLKSLPEDSYFNVVGFGGTFQKLFDRSEVYNDSSLNRACSHAQGMEANLGGTEILAPLQEVNSQPLIKGYPRQIFLLTDGEVSNTSEVIEVVRRFSSKARCFTFGIGEGASSRLVKGVARAGRGTAEFVSGNDRLQTKVMKTLKHALQPALKDISLTWNLPKTWTVETVPANDLTVYNGNPLIVYGILSRYDTPPRSPITAIEGTVTLNAHIYDGQRLSVVRHALKFSAVCGNPAESNLLLHRLCAKARIMEDESDENVVQISKSANIVSRLTSFVGVDKSSGAVISRPIQQQHAHHMQMGRAFAFYGNGHAKGGYSGSEVMVPERSATNHMGSVGTPYQPTFISTALQREVPGTMDILQPMEGYSNSHQSTLVSVTPHREDSRQPRSEMDGDSGPMSPPAVPQRSSSAAPRILQGGGSGLRSDASPTNLRRDQCESTNISLAGGRNQPSSPVRDRSFAVASSRKVGSNPNTPPSSRRRDYSPRGRNHSSPPSPPRRDHSFTAASSLLGGGSNPSTPPPVPRRSQSSKIAGDRILNANCIPDESNTGQRTYLPLVALQTASGAWKPTDRLVDIFGQTLEWLQRTCPRQLHHDNVYMLWATALAVAFLVQTFPRDKDEWEIVANKATRWLKMKLPKSIGFDEIMYSAMRCILER